MATIDGLVLAPGETIFVRWSDLDIAGAEDDLAIDDLSVTAPAAPPAVLNVVQNARIEGIGSDRKFAYALEVAHAPGSGQAAKGVIAELLLPPGSLRAGEALIQLVDAVGITLLTPAQDGDAGSATDSLVAIVFPVVEHPLRRPQGHARPRAVNAADHAGARADYEGFDTAWNTNDCSRMQRSWGFGTSRDVSR